MCSIMKKLRIISLIALIIAVFVSIDLGLNLLCNFIPEYLDGYTSHSILQGIFGIFGDRNWTLGRFYNDFEISVWVAFLVFVENVVLTIIDMKKKI